MEPEVVCVRSNAYWKAHTLHSAFQSLLIVCLLTGTLWAADDPLAGKWKVNSSKSRLYDELRVEAAGANRYKLTFGPDQIDTITADGTDQPALSGTTFSITVKGPNNWEVVRKLNGRMLLKAEWTLSADGKTLTDDFTQYLPDGLTLFSTPLPNGSALFLPYVYDRTTGNSGFLGTWDSESAKVSPRLQLEIKLGERDGLSLKRSDEETEKKFILDGKDHTELDASGKDTGTSYSARRVNERRLEITFKSKGEVTSTRQIELPPDLKTLTVTDRLPGQNKPKSILVFDRQ